MLLLIGWIPRYRAALYESAYQLGWRKRPVPVRSAPELIVPKARAGDVIEQGAPHWNGLTQAINELFTDKPELRTMRHVAGTTLVVWDRSA